MAEKNIDAEIKKKHEEFDKKLEDFMAQIRAKESPSAGLSPAIQALRQRGSGLRNRIAPTRR